MHLTVPWMFIMKELNAITFNNKHTFSMILELSFEQRQKNCFSKWIDHDPSFKKRISKTNIFQNCFVTWFSIVLIQYILEIFMISKMSKESTIITFAISINFLTKKAEIGKLGTMQSKWSNYEKHPKIFKK